MDKNKNDDLYARIEGFKKSFIEYNEAKIASLRASLPDHEIVDLFDLIPFLFTVNRPEFPGYVKEMIHPPGIRGYSASRGIMNKIKMFSPEFHPGSTDSSEPLIRLVALIGSTGTIAFTPESDFDFWLCGFFDEKDPEIIAMLRRKCRIIEDWVMEKHGKEVHFFLNDVSRVKKNLFDEDEEYGLSGTSLGQLLKEEFYRSSIIIEGQIPFWWVVPAGSSDEEYGNWFRATKGTPLENEFIDLGNLVTMNRGDFLIAALFQIVKSLGNPFKSIIKLGLLEKYIYDKSDNPFISNLIKQNVHEGKMERSQVDAYCIMFDQVYDYYGRVQDDQNSISVIKTCFYLKVNPRLSEQSARPEYAKVRDIMRDYVKKWGWDNSTVKHIDNFENWDIEATNRMMNNTKKKILKGYKNILGAIGSELNAGHIDKESLVGINRKIFSHFKPEDNKIDNTLNFKKYPPEKLLTLDFVTDIKSNDAWYLNKRIIAAGKPIKFLISKNRHLISLIVWISLNGLYQKNYTRLEIDTGFYHMEPSFIRDLISELSSHFSMKNLNLQNSYFLREPFPIMSYLIINPFHKYSHELNEIYFVYHNSWGETRFELFRSINDLPPIMERIIGGALNSGMDAEAALRIIASEPYSSSKEYRTLRSTMKDMLSFFVSGVSGEKLRFFTMVGNQRLIFSSSLKKRERSMVSLYPCKTDNGMLFAVSYNRGGANRIEADANIPEFRYLGEILSRYSEDSVSIFFEDNGRNRFSRFFVLNECGSLMLFRKRTEHHSVYLAGLIAFTESVLCYVSANSEEGKNDKEIKVYKINTDHTGAGVITEYDYNKDFKLHKIKEDLVPVTLSLHLLADGEVGYRFSLPDGAFSEILSRGEVEGASRDIAELMKSVNKYYYYPSFVNLDHIDIRMYTSCTSFAFSEKNRFETFIEKNLN